MREYTLTNVGPNRIQNNLGEQDCLPFRNDNIFWPKVGEIFDWNL